MRIFRSFLWTAFVGLALASCAPPDALRSVVISTTPAGNDSVAVTHLGPVITIPAPAPYCIDTSQSGQSANGALLVMQDCAFSASALLADVQVPLPILLSVTVHPAALADIVGLEGADLLSLLEEELQDGQRFALVSRGGQTENLRIVETRLRGDILYAYVHDRGMPSSSALRPRYARSFTEVNGHLVVATASAFGPNAGYSYAALDQLELFHAELRRSNPGL